MKNTFTHGYGERNSIKLKALTQETGIKGYGVYWFILEYLHEEENVLELKEVNLKGLALQFKITLEELNSIIESLTRYELFVLKGKILFSEEVGVKVKRTQEIAKKRSVAGKRSVKIRKQNKNQEEVLINPINEEEPVTVIFEEIKPIEKPKPKPRTKKEAPKKIEKSSFKEWEFLTLFNELKLEKKPKAKGHTVLTSTDKKNFLKLTECGYGREEFTLVINTAFENKWVKENDMDIPEHVLRHNNFERYLNQSQSKKTKEFVENQTEEIVYK
ncbi:hypothetical protein F132_54 [Flavobacterium sp. phage 1/32]|nr:hypothetical protein F132_54 [Flavobacterium sp. phage 1/32]